MKLRRFNLIDCKKKPTKGGVPKLTVSKYGNFFFNRELSDKMGFVKGMRLNFAQDQERPADWYFEKTIDKDGIPLREIKHGFKLQARAVALLLLDSIGSDKTKSFMVSPAEEHGYFAIITKSAENG